MSDVKWELDFAFHKTAGIKGSLNFTHDAESKAKAQWQEYYKPFAEKINSEGGMIRAYVIEGGFKLNPKLEGISDELKAEIKAAGLKV